MNQVYIILILILIVLCLDGIYLSLIKNLMNTQVEKIQGSPIQLNYASVFVTYVLVIIGLYYFIIKEKRSIWDAFLLGFVIYGIYECTNMSLFNKWDMKIVMIDSIWGGLLFMIATFIIYLQK